MKSCLLQIFNNSGTREDLSIIVDTGAVYLHGIMQCWHTKGSLGNNEELNSVEKVLQPRLQNLTEKHSVLIFVKYLLRTPC